MATEKRKHTPIEPPSPPQDSNRQVDILPVRARRPMPVVAQRKRLSTQLLPQDNVNPVRPQKTVFGRLGHRDHVMPQSIVKPQQAAALAAAVAGVCRNFQRRGHCKYGDKCIYSHQLPSGSEPVDEQMEQKGDLRVTRTTSVSSAKRADKTESLRKVVLEETHRDAPTNQAHSSTYNEGREYEEALSLERRRQEIKLELERLEAEPKQQKDLIISIDTTAKSSPSEGEASSSSGDDAESSDQQSSNDQEAVEEPIAQPRSAIIVPHPDDQPSRSSNREERRPRSIVNPVAKSSRTQSAARKDSRPVSGDKDRKRSSNEPRRDATRSAARPALSERATVSSLAKRSRTHTQREAVRPPIRGPPLQSQEDQYRERRADPPPAHSDPKRQESRRPSQRHDGNTRTGASSSTQPTNSSGSRSHQRSQLPSASEDRSHTDRSRSREHQRQSQHKLADGRARESAPRESARNMAAGEEHSSASRRGDDARRNQYVPEVDDRVGSDEYARQHANPRKPTRPKPLTDLMPPADAAPSQRAQELTSSISIEYTRKRPPLSRHIASISETLSGNKSTDFQRSDRGRPKDLTSKKRPNDQLAADDAALQSKTQLEPPHKQSRKESPRSKETKAYDDAQGGGKLQSTVTIHDTEFTVDVISDDEEDAAVDHVVDQVTDDASDAKDHLSGEDTPPSHTPTRADAGTAEVESENKVTKPRKKFLSYGESTGSIDERALPEAEELEDISDDELGDASSISSAAHGGHHKLSAADWASLIEPKQISEKAPYSARQRFTPENFLRTCAISSKHVSPTLAAQIEQTCNLKTEQDATADAPKTAFRFMGESAAEHMTRMREAEALSSPFQLVGVHRRALCARDDLRFRRRLCGYGPELADPSITNEHGIPFLSSLFEKSKQLFADQQKIVA